MTRCRFLLASCITLSLLTPAAFAHGHRHGNGGAQLGTSSAANGFRSDAATTTDATGKPDANPRAATASDTHAKDDVKAQRKPARTPDEEELMQAEH